MDPLGTTASIIAVIQLSSKVVQCISTATGATKERKRLRTELQACDDVLQQLKDEANDDSQEGKAWLKTIEALEAPGAPLGRLLVILKVVQAKLEPKDGLKKAIATLRWPFEEKEMEKIINAIEREKSLLDLALTSETRKLLQNIQRSSRENAEQLAGLVAAITQLSTDQHIQFAQVHSGIAQVLGSQATIRDDMKHLHTRQERQHILDWLTPIDYAPQQADFLHRRQPGTGQWLLDTTNYKDWAMGHQQTLFCPGIPGAGKTILTSIVVDDLYKKYPDTSVAVCYIYCNFRRKDEQTLTDLFLSLLRQIAQSQPSLPDSVRELYNRHQPRRTRPSLEDVVRASRSAALAYSKVFIIIDALDECQMSDGCRERFLTKTLDFQQTVGANLFATSRFISEITDRFAHCPSVEIRASEHDIYKYLEGHMSGLPGFVAQNPALQVEIKTKITQAVDGMFLLAQFHIACLVGKKSPKAVRNALGNLVTGSNACDSAYYDMMQRIEGQLQDQEKLAKQVLSWITHAKRPLTTLELQHALAVEIGEPELDEDNLPQIEDMVSVCAGLVTVDEQSSIIRLVHYSTQKFFERTHSKWFPNAQSEITTVCTTYLSFETFASGIALSDEEFEDRLRSNPYYDYATHHWSHHAHVATGCRGTLLFLRKQAQVEASYQALLAKKYSINSIKSINHSQDRPRQMTGLHLAAYFGLAEEVQILSDEHDVDVQDSRNQTPLLYASGEGHEAVVKVLLKKGADIENQDIASHLPHTPLLLASMKGHEMVVRLLLENGANIEATENMSKCGFTPLSMAAIHGHELVVNVLLEKGAKFNLKDFCGLTPLHWAAVNGHETVVKLLLEKGAEVDANDIHGRTPLQWATKRRHETVVKLLVEKGAKVNTKDNDKWTTLH